MNSTKLWMTAQTPSRFGMPFYGSAFGTACLGTAARTGSAAVATVVRDRHVTGAVATIEGSFPGTSAWRPPTC